MPFTECAHEGGLANARRTHKGAQAAASWCAFCRDLATSHYACVCKRTEAHISSTFFLNSSEALRRSRRVALGASVGSVATIERCMCEQHRAYIPKRGFPLKASKSGTRRSSVLGALRIFAGHIFVGSAYLQSCSPESSSCVAAGLGVAAQKSCSNRLSGQQAFILVISSSASGLGVH